MGYINGVDRNQITLLPESIDDYVGEDNAVSTVATFLLHDHCYQYFG